MDVREHPSDLSTHSFLELDSDSDWTTLTHECVILHLHTVALLVLREDEPLPRVFCKLQQVFFQDCSVC